MSCARPPTIGILVVAALLAACSGKPAVSPSASRPPRDPPGGAVLPNCANEDRILSGDTGRRPGRVVADLDGRPGLERAWIAVAPSSGNDCSAWLVVQASFGRAGAPIAGVDDTAFSPLGLPVLSGAVSIDDNPGAEIVVDVTAGASTTMVGVFALSERDVVRVDVVGPGAPPDDLFAHGGSVGHVHAVDCAGQSTVVVSQANAAARRYVVERRYFLTDGPVWRAQPERAERATASARQLMARWPEFRASPFLTCQ